MHVSISGTPSEFFLASVPHWHFLIPPNLFGPDVHLGRREFSSCKNKWMMTAQGLTTWKRMSSLKLLIEGNTYDQHLDSKFQIWGMIDSEPKCLPKNIFVLLWRLIEGNQDLAFSRSRLFDQFTVQLHTCYQVLVSFLFLDWLLQVPSIK